MKKLILTNDLKNVIKSFLDIDFYKLTMAQFVFFHARGDWAEYTFTDRKKMRLGNILSIKDINYLIDQISGLKPTITEISYLRGLLCNGKPMFREEFLTFLSNINLGDCYVDVSTVGGSLEIKVKGKWETAIFYETMILSLINQLHSRYVIESISNIDYVAMSGSAFVRLRNKLRLLMREPDISIIEFGTRRRCSSSHQIDVYDLLLDTLGSQCIGSSNVFLSMLAATKPIGTFAHELMMGMHAKKSCITGIKDSKSFTGLEDTQKEVLDDWYAMYGYDLSIALTDTYTSKVFFEKFTDEQANQWKGMRHDSGDPIKFGYAAINFYLSKNIDPKQKTIVFSDGLDAYTILKIHNEFKGKINVVFGWGTDLTNDFEEKDTLSVVMKLTSLNHVGTVKISDNPGKESGTICDIEIYKKIFKIE